MVKYIITRKASNNGAKQLELLFFPFPCCENEIEKSPIIKSPAF